MPEELGEGLLGERLTETFLLVTPAADPAAGAEAAVTVPGRARWELYSFLVELTTAAPLGNRVPSLIASDQTTIFLRLAQSTNHAASLTHRYCWARGLVSIATSIEPFLINAPLPPIELLPGFQIRTETQALDAGDNYTAPILFVRELAERGPVAELAYELRELGERLSAFEQLVPEGVS